MKWFLFTMYVTMTGEVADWKEPVPFDTPGECSTALVATLEEMKADTAAYEKRAVLCDVVNPAELDAARAFYHEQYAEKPF